MDTLFMVGFIVLLIPGILLEKRWLATRSQSSILWAVIFFVASALCLACFVVFSR